jgi:hypothetical protein
MHNPPFFYFSHNCVLALLLPLDRTVPGMGSGHGAVAPAPWGPPLLQRLPWHTPLRLWQHLSYSFFRMPNPTQGRHGWGRLVGGDYGERLLKQG